LNSFNKFNKVLCVKGGVFLSVTGCEALFADLGKNKNISLKY
jgi:K+ transporter